MENVLAVIAEYNPFHNGHVYHLNKSKTLTNSNYSIAIISGNFTQRGNTSLVDKWSKANMALSNGFDLVIELPTIYATSSAENFAYGAIKILNSLNIVDYISFGSECPDIFLLDKFSSVLADEPKEYKKLLSMELAKGISYPKAREKALISHLKLSKRTSSIISSPNNILAIEYLKSLKLLKSDMSPIAIKRIEAEYNDQNLKGEISSATSIRNAILNGELSNIANTVSDSSFDILKENFDKGHIIPDISFFDNIILYNLRSMEVSDLLNIPDVSEGLEFSIKKAANSCNTVEELINIVSSKRYTRTRIQRILIYVLLGITKKDIALSKRTSPYVRILGFNDNGKALISKINKLNSKINIITSVKKFYESNTNRNLKRMMDIDVFATNTYTLGYQKDSWGNLDYTQKLIRTNRKTLILV